MKDNNLDNDFMFDWVKKISSPKTHSTMVPPLIEQMLKEDFKLNISIEKNNKPVTPSNALINSTVNNNFTNKVLNTNQVNREENSQIRKKFTLNNGDNNIASTVFRINNLQQNSINEIE
jgi:hypothetical protein